MDCVETNTFGANHAALAEYDIADRIHELSEAGARIAREVGRRVRRPRRPPALGARLDRPRHQAADPRPHRRTRTLRDAYQQNAEGLLAGGADALLVETTQDLLQTKAVRHRRPPRHGRARRRPCR